MHKNALSSKAPVFRAQSTPSCPHRTGFWFVLKGWFMAVSCSPRALQRALLLASAVLAAHASSALAAGDGPQLDLPRVELAAGMHRIDAQVAQTNTARTIGLMNRKDMPMHEGMLFIFEQPGVQCFWMKNTLMPLTAAFVADDGTVVNLADMKPQSLDSHCSAKPVRYVLEMHQGWFAKRAIKAGFKLQGTPFRKP